MKYLILLLTAFTYAQNQPITLSPERAEIIYNGLKEGEMCKDDMNAAQELIQRQSKRIESMAKEFREASEFAEQKIRENDSLYAERERLAVKIATDKAKMKYDKTWAISVQAGYGLGLYQNEVIVIPAFTVGISKTIFRF